MIDITIDRANQVISQKLESKQVRLQNRAFKMLIIFLFFDYGRPQVFFPFIGKLHLGYILHPILAIYLWKMGKLFKLETAQEKAFVGLIFLMFLHIPFAENNYMAYWGWRNWVLAYIVFLSVKNFVNSYEKFFRFINYWILIAIFTTIVGIKDGGKIPSAFFLADENEFALFMNMCIGITFFLALYSDRNVLKMFYYLAMLIFSLGNIVAMSRGGFVGLVGMGFFIWLRTPKKVLSTFLLGLLGVIFFIMTPESYWKEVATLKQEGLHRGTVGDRWYSWKCGIKMFLDNPIFGVGQNNFAWNFQKYEPKEEGKKYGGRAHAGREAHSIFITSLTELGIVGTYLYFLIYVKSRKDLWDILKIQVSSPQAQKFLDKVKYIVYSLDVAMIGFLATGAFLTVNYYPHYYILSALMMSLTDIIKDNLIQLENKPISLSN